MGIVYLQPIRCLEGMLFHHDGGLAVFAKGKWNPFITKARSPPLCILQQHNLLSLSLVLTSLVYMIGKIDMMNDLREGFQKQTIETQVKIG